MVMEEQQVADFIERVSLVQFLLLFYIIFALLYFMRDRMWSVD